jgi:hypothetical protein
VVYLVFYDPAFCRIIQVQVKSKETRFEGSEMIEEIKYSTEGKYAKLMEFITSQSNVENNSAVKTFAEAYEMCEKDKPLYFNDLAGSETILSKI